MKIHLISMGLLLLALVSGPVMAEIQLRRCVVTDGMITYSSSDIPGANCKIIGKFKTSPVVSSWTLVSKSDAVAVSTYDSSVVRSKNSVKVWVLYSYLENQVDQGRYYRSAKELDVYDCHAATVTTMTNIEYLGENGEGRVMASYQYRRPTPTDIAPETIGAAIFNKFCPSRSSDK